jgi:hypothetical protein
LTVPDLQRSVVVDLGVLDVLVHQAEFKRLPWPASIAAEGEPDAIVVGQAVRRVSAFLTGVWS